jgi:F0F1-type ATP synthase assembly protein I
VCSSDLWLETRPLFLIVFFFLGAAAGALNVYRRAHTFVASGELRETKIPAEPPEDND